MLLLKKRRVYFNVGFLGEDEVDYEFLEWIMELIIDREGKNILLSIVVNVFDNKDKLLLDDSEKSDLKLERLK